VIAPPEITSARGFDLAVQRYAHLCMLTRVPASAQRCADVGQRQPGEV
jgi:hypothetical protein